MNKEQMIKTDEFKELVKQFMIEELKIGDKIKVSLFLIS